MLFSLVMATHQDNAAVAVLQALVEQVKDIKDLVLVARRVAHEN
jgi:hypothetical protein